MKSLNKYISGGFFGNTKTSKNDLIMEWIYKYITKTYPSKIISEICKITDRGNMIDVSFTCSGQFEIGNAFSEPLNGMPPINLISDYTSLRALHYNCEIKKFGVPLNIDDYDAIYFNKVSNMIKNPDIFNQTCKVINDCKSIKNIYFRHNDKIDKNNINIISYGDGFEELKRNFELISFNNTFFDKIKFNINTKVNNIFIDKTTSDNILPKIITLPICKNLCFSYKYGYKDILKMLSDYIPNPSLRKIHITNINRMRPGELKRIENIVLGKNEIIR